MRRRKSPLRYDPVWRDFRFTPTSCRVLRRRRIKILDKPRDIYSDEIDSEKDEIKKQFEEEVNFDTLTTRSLTISDLKEMKKEQKGNITDREFLDPFSEEPIDEEDRLSKEELDKIIYGL